MDVVATPTLFNPPNNSGMCGCCSSLCGWHPQHHQIQGVYKWTHTIKRHSKSAFLPLNKSILFFSLLYICMQRWTGSSCNSLVILSLSNTKLQYYCIVTPFSEQGKWLRPRNVKAFSHQPNNQPCHWVSSAWCVLYCPPVCIIQRPSFSVHKSYFALIGCLALVNHYRGR